MSDSPVGVVCGTWPRSDSELRIDVCQFPAASDSRTAYTDPIQHWLEMSVISAGTHSQTVPMSAVIALLVRLNLKSRPRPTAPSENASDGRPSPVAAERLWWLPLWQRIHCLDCRNMVSGQ